MNITNKGNSEIRAWGGASFQNQIPEEANAKVTVNITEEEGSSMYIGPRDEKQGDTSVRVYDKNIDCKINGDTPDNKETYRSGIYKVDSPADPGESDTNEGKAIAIGTSNITSPTKPQNTSDAWKGNYVYFGTNAGGPVKYKVLDPNTSVFGGNTILLDCDSVLDTREFDQGAGEEWLDSSIRTYLNGIFLDKNFSILEQKSIASSSKNVEADTDGSGYMGITYTPLVNDKIFFLDLKEATNTSYGYSDDPYTVENRKKTGEGCFLRTIFGMMPIRICDDGHFESAAMGISGVSPALNINLSSILFSSAVEMNKTSELKWESTKIATTNTTEWKLTLKDDNKKIKITEDKKVQGVYGIINIPYTVTDEGKEKANQISVMITDKEYTASGTQILYYGALRNVDLSGLNAASAISGTGELYLPTDLSDKTLGTDYHIYILAEQVNSSKASDYASEPVEITYIYNALDYVGIKGLDKPIAGKELDADVEVKTYPYSCNVTKDIKWYVGTAKAPEVAGYNKAYTVQITLTPDVGYVFSDTLYMDLVDNNYSNMNQNRNADGTITVTVDFPTTAKAKIKKINYPESITKKNGTDIEDIVSSIPTEVDIVTGEDLIVKAAAVWSFSDVEYMYDPSKLMEQAIPLGVRIIYPEEIDSTDRYLDVYFNIVILAAEMVKKPTADIADDIYTENKSVTLSSATDGATIYYTTDGTKPSVSEDGITSPSTKLYKEPIFVSGEQGRIVSTTIRAIAVKSGMFTSAEAEFNYTIKIPHIHGFDNASWQHNETEHWHKCNVENCDGGEESITDKEAHEFTYTYTWSEDYKECTAKRKCDVCEYSDSETATVKTTVTQEKTCTQPEFANYVAVFENKGFTEQKKEDIKTSEAAGHSFAEWETIESSACEDTGSQQRTCKVCSYTETKIIEAAGHSWNSDYTVDRQPGCTTEGSKSIHCKNCDAVKESQVIAATGHSFTEWETAKSATCEESGSQQRACTVCDDTEIKEIEAVGHTEGDWIVDKAATVENTGSRHKECTVCGKTLETEVIKKLESIPTVNAGDTSDMNLWPFVCVVSLVGLAGGAFVIIKRRNNR